MDALNFVNLLLSGICIGALLFWEKIGYKIWGLVFGIANLWVGFTGLIRG